MNDSLSAAVSATLAERGLPPPVTIVQSMLMKDRYFIGWKFRYDGGYAVLLAGANSLEFYDQQGTLLKAIAFSAEREAA